VDSAAQNGARADDDAERSDAEERRFGTAGGQTGTARVKRGMAEMLKGGVIMDVVTPEQAVSPRAPAPSR
jgi:pyridoxal 5'-phosphate synthase pdxS subunit